MAVVLNSTPAAYSSAQGDLIFTAYEATKANDNATYPNYKYVCDIYIGGNLVHRERAFPHPTHKRGIFNIGPVVRNYLAMDFNHGTGIVAQEFKSGNLFIDVTLKFGEEYGFTTYTDLTVDSTRRYYNHYNSQILSDPTVLDTYLGLAASNRPYENTISLNAVNHFIPYFADTTGGVQVQVKTYNSSNSLVDTQNVTYSASEANILQQLNVSPTAINSVFSGLIDGTTKYYTVQTGNGTVGSIYKFTLACENVYTTYTLHFLNQLGGFDSMEFRKSSKKTYDIEKKDFTQLPYRVDGSGAVTYANSGNVVNETKTVYSSQFKPKLRLTTDLLTDADWSWLKELSFSPLVYLQDGVFLKPVMITSNNYEERTYLNNKLTPLVVDLDLGVQLNAQYR